CIGLPIIGIVENNENLQLGAFAFLGITLALIVVLLLLSKKHSWISKLVTWLFANLPGNKLACYSCERYVFALNSTNVNVFTNLGYLCPKCSHVVCSQCAAEAAVKFGANRYMCPACGHELVNDAIIFHKKNMASEEDP
ncbi:MAG TPA: hypothetical protein PKH07_18010, partial [bacterium]|nr:hypothetical protein [bacterium]